MRPRGKRTSIPVLALLGGALCLTAAESAAARKTDRGERESPAAAAAPEQPRLELERAGGPPRYGRRVTLVATLTARGRPLPGREVSLTRSNVLVAKGATNGRGKARFVLEARESSRYEARFAPASMEDATAYAPAASPPIDLVVRPVVTVRLSSPLRAGRKVVGIPKERVRVTVGVKPFSGDQRVVVRIVHRGREIRRRTAALVKRGEGGRLRFRFRPARRGTYTIRVVQPAGRSLGAARAPRKRLLVVRPSARPGARGSAVRALQRRLAALGYLTPVNGHFGGSTARAVLAFRKVNGMGRSSAAGRGVFRRLARGGGGFRPRHARAGKHVEFDWSRQILVLARGSRPVMAVHASSGKTSTPTVLGSFRFYSKTPGFNSKGMYYSSYFIGGYAIHGYKSVPMFPASHGCIRIPIASAVRVYRWIDRGDPIFVYR